MEDDISVESVDAGEAINMDDTPAMEMDSGDDRSLEDFLVDSGEDEEPIVEPETMAETSEVEAPNVADKVDPTATEEITQERIDQYFKSDDVYKELHNEFINSDPDYKAAYTLLQDGSALQQFLSQNNQTFSNTQDLNLKASILHQAQTVLSQQIETALVKSADSYKAQASEYIAAQQLDKYLNENAANLNGVSKLTGDLYNTIVAKAGLPNDEKSKTEVSNAINNVFLGLSRQFNIHPTELIKVIENFGSKQDAQAALNNLQNSSKLKIVAKEKAKSITKGGATNVNSRRNEFEDILEQYAI